MRIVDRKTFLALPAGTIYAKWGDKDGDPTHMFYGEVSMKGDTCGNDFVDQPFFTWPEGCENDGQWTDAMDLALAGATTAPMIIGDSGCRDGLFDERQRFAVYDRIEVERLVALLQSGLQDAY